MVAVPPAQVSLLAWWEMPWTSLPTATLSLSAKVYHVVLLWGGSSVTLLP